MEETIGSLEAHEERVRGKIEGSGGEQQLLLTEEEWVKKESVDGQVLLTREEWLKRTNKGGTHSDSEARVKDFVRSGRDRSKIRCINCSAYGHYASEYRKSRRTKEQRNEVNLTQTNDDEPNLLLACPG